MGIPKFFRYISERYPLTSQLIQENKIPEFDNLYIDFNGIIHQCSHPNDEDAHFRLSEEQIFTSIFAYVDHLFSKIKPKKLFFMAVDGVAPRAKMNQQRSRRFRTAKEAREVREKAERKGEKLPDEKAFDSNCITPGTDFMCKLSNQLRYFINKKISEDANWREVQVVLSGHEVPGEGEHKINDYIRLARAQPDYDPNIRHCLYGLDADLIMLGLLSHDPHFCLLREEVKFGPSARKKNHTDPGSIDFYLLHLSLLREYLDLEFYDLSSVLPFTYSLERVIDDFILLAVFVGNDFLPNLPDLHIHSNGLEKLFEVYKTVLPKLDGYINERGTINMQRLQILIGGMAEWEQEIFEKEYADMGWFKGKQSRHAKGAQKERRRSNLALTKSQLEVFDKVRSFVLSNRNRVDRPPSASLALQNTFSARDRAFIIKLAEDLNMNLSWDEYDQNEENLVTWRFSKLTEAAVDGSTEESEESEDEESREAVDRVLKKYEKAPVIDTNEEAFEGRHQQLLTERMNEWKQGYYREKLGMPYHDQQQMHDLIFTYAKSLQWVMHYYYSGVASWGWFYDYHYAPRISDLQDLDKMEFTFDIGTPFRPFEQLMGVLPEASKELLPPAYRDLMYDVNSPILDFYPTEFDQDLNGKKQDWEAVVKIPFIDEERLLKAMASREHQLTAEEKKRNTFGTSINFSYNPAQPFYYASSLPGFLPNLPNCMCRMDEFDLPTLNGLPLVDGLREGVALGAEALAGFPSLKTLPHSAHLDFHGINVHGSESRNKSMIVHINNPYELMKAEDVAEELIGKRTFVGWPFLREGLVTAVSSEQSKYEKIAHNNSSAKKVVSNPHTPASAGFWKTKAQKIQDTYSKRCGVITGPIEILLHVRPLKGMSRLETGALVKEYESADYEAEHAVQMTLPEVVSEDPRYLEKDAPPLSEEYPEGSKVFFLGEHAYGVAAQVSGTTETSLSVILAFSPFDKTENEELKALATDDPANHYHPSFKAADMLGMSGRALSRITSSLMVVTSDGQKVNLGLSLKFEMKRLKVIGYSRKDGRNWEFSDAAIKLIRDYKSRFPALFLCLDDSGDALLKSVNIFPGSDADLKVRDIRSWLKTQGVRDFEPVSLISDLLGKDTISNIEAFTDKIAEKKVAFKRAIVKGIPRQAVLKPSHAVYRLQNQHFALGDRVTMVRDSGGVPLALKGVVVGLNSKSLDVVWDVPFLSGITLGDRCSLYRGSTVDFNSCLNLTNPQYITPTHTKEPSNSRQKNVPKPSSSHLSHRPPPRSSPAPGPRSPPFRPGPKVSIMTNPNHVRKGLPNGGPPPVGNHSAPPARMNGNLGGQTHRGAALSSRGENVPSRGGGGLSPSYRARGFASGGRGSRPSNFRGRGQGVS